MTEIHPHKPPLDPVPAAVERPLWSVMIPTFNCASYLRETLGSVLVQDVGPNEMQIEVVDDCSQADDPQAVVAELGKGRVDFHRQPHNLGHVRNLNACIERSRGHLVHILHGDDTVRESFYRLMQRPFQNDPTIGLAFCRHVYVDEAGRETTTARLHLPDSGILPDAAYRIASDIGIQPPAVVVRRSAYERVDGFDDRFRVAGEDLEMWVRIAASYPVWYEVERLASYHRRPGSLVSNSVRTGAAIRDYRAAIDIAAGHLDPDRRRSARRAARRRCAAWALTQARELADAGDRSATFVQLREALLSSRAPRVIAQSLETGTRSLLGWRSRRP